MPLETVEYVVVWDVWFSHSNCTPGPDHEDRNMYYEEWPEAATDIERFLCSRPDGCAGTVLVDRISMPRSEWDALQDPSQEPADA